MLSINRPRLEGQASQGKRLQKMLSNKQTALKAKQAREAAAKDALNKQDRVEGQAGQGSSRQGCSDQTGCVARQASRSALGSKTGDATSGQQLAVHPTAISAAGSAAAPIHAIYWPLNRQQPLAHSNPPKQIRAHARNLTPIIRSHPHLRRSWQRQKPASKAAPSWLIVSTCVTFAVMMVLTVWWLSPTLTAS